LPITDHITHQPLQPIFRLGIPCLFYASSRLWPEIGRIVRAAQAKRDEVVDLVVMVRFLGVVGKPDFARSLPYRPNADLNCVCVMEVSRVEFLALRQPASSNRLALRLGSPAISWRVALRSGH
jgi:hypothetical protein